MTARRVVITGIGPVTSVGIGKEVFFKNILHHKTCIKKIPPVFESHYPFQSRYYVPFPRFSLSDYEISEYFESIMQNEDRTSLLATKLALEDAGFSLFAEGHFFKVPEIPDCSIIMGTGFSGLETAFNSYLAHVIADHKTRLEILKRDTRYHRMVIPMMMPNSVSAWISIIFKLRGSNYTVNASCSSGTYAIGEAFRKIREGRAQVILAGGVECLKDDFGGIMRGFDMLGVLTKSLDGRPIPFSKKRNGFLFSEGAGCMLVLEELGHAIKRGAPIYAEICDFYANSDAYNIVQMDKSGSRIIELLKMIKGDRKIDYINAHGTGTQENDRIETAAINKVFGDGRTQPYINSTKGLLGHALGASGALEAAVTALSIKASKIHGNMIPEPMDDANLVFKTMSFPIRYAISTSYGFGGHNGGLVFKRYE